MNWRLAGLILLTLLCLTATPTVRADDGYYYPARGQGNAAMYRGSYRGGSGLPAGRRYYNGRYFGNLNNRYYGPQYGYF